MNEAKQLLKRAEYILGYANWVPEYCELRKKIRAYLSTPEPEQEPVGTLDHNGKFKLLRMVGIPIGEPIKLYERLVPRHFVRLTDEEILEIVGSYPTAVGGYTRMLFDKIQDKLEEKNNEH